MQKILYVEDDLSLIDGLQYTLENSGYAVDNAKTVKEALSLFRKNRYDLLLTGNGRVRSLIAYKTFSTFHIPV